MEEKDELNKNDFVYLNFAQLRHGGVNPFLTSLVTEKNNHVGLIDTGVDVSIMHLENVPSNVSLIRKNTMIRSTSGELLKIVGQAVGVKVKLGPKE